MDKYILSCCSTADLTPTQIEEWGINYICFHYEVDGVEYKDDLGQSVDFEEFYARMSKGVDTKTSQVNADEFEEYFRPFLQEGKDILHICLSSGISGVYNSAMIAKEDLAEEFPDRKIYVLDSLGASGGYGMMMYSLSQMAKSGKPIEELVEFVEKSKLNVHHWFFSTDLTYYVKGGRVSKTAGFVGTLLNICPVLNMDYEGHLVPRMKVRTKKKAKDEVVKLMIENAENGTGYDGPCFITHSACMEDAKEVAMLIEEKFPKLKGKVVINYIGTTIGSHTGPGTVALFYYGKKRED